MMGKKYGERVKKALFHTSSVAVGVDTMGLWGLAEICCTPDFFLA